MKRFSLVSLLPLLFLLAGCKNTVPVVTVIVPTVEIDLTRYATETLTPTMTDTPINAPTATLAPTQTPTPRAYAVKDKDTMSVIAFRNGLTLEELKAANPGVDPYLLTVGMTLYIPAPSNISATAQAPTPTAVALGTGAVNCLTSATGGKYCFAVVNNGQEFEVGNISAEFRLTNPVNGEVLTRPATLPAARIGAGSSTVLFAFFAPPVFTNPQVTLQLLTASQAGSATVNPPAVSITDPVVTISDDGLSVAVSGQVSVDAGSADTATVWVTAAAFDANGRVTGVRRLELADGVMIGSAVPFEMIIYSLGGKIDRVELYTDAIP
jgi:LysM repeat protein